MKSVNTEISWMAERIGLKTVKWLSFPVREDLHKATLCPL